MNISTDIQRDIRHLKANNGRKQLAAGVNCKTAVVRDALAKAMLAGHNRGAGGVSEFGAVEWLPIAVPSRKRQDQRNMRIKRAVGLANW